MLRKVCFLKNGTVMPQEHTCIAVFFISCKSAVFSHAKQPSVLLIEAGGILIVLFILYKYIRKGCALGHIFQHDVLTACIDVPRKGTDTAENTHKNREIYRNERFNRPFHNIIFPTVFSLHSLALQTFCSF